MVNQKMICFKIDHDLLKQLDAFVDINESKCNTALNMLLCVALMNLSHYAVCRLLADYGDQFGIDWVKLLDSKGSINF